MLITGYLNTLIGSLQIQVSDLGVKSIRFIDEIPDTYQYAPSGVKPYLDQLGDYFEGKRKRFEVSIDWTGIPSFHKEVLKMVYTIPYGKTRTYKQIATFLGNEKAARAVGQANGHNPIAIVIPCHRVIGNNGKLTGYAYGISKKMKLLGLENPASFMPQMDIFTDLSSTPSKGLLISP